MHCVFSYDLSAPAGVRRNEIETKINDILKSHRNVRRLTTFYILHVQSIKDWENLRVQLTNYVTSIQERIHFIMTPPINGGYYNGILNNGEWDEINAIAAM